MYQLDTLADFFLMVFVRSGVHSGEKKILLSPQTKIYIIARIIKNPKEVALFLCSQEMKDLNF